MWGKGLIGTIVLAIGLQHAWAGNGVKKLADTRLPRESCERLLKALQQQGRTVEAFRESQEALLPGLYFDLERLDRLHSEAERTLYTASARYAARHRPTEAPNAYGVSFDAKTGSTVISTFGDPGLIDSIEVVVLEHPDPRDPRNNAASGHHLTHQGALRWTVKLDGDLEGKWYFFKVRSRAGQKDFRGQPLPAQFETPDITSPKVSRYGTSQVYFWPDPALRPPRPDPKGPLNLLEIDLLSLTPPDVPRELWGTPRAIIQSRLMQRLIRDFDGIELLPIRHSAWVELVDPANPHFYAHYWGYMPQDYSIAAAKGGPEQLIELIDWLHLNGKVVIEDSVLQHTANPPIPAFAWMLRDGYLCRDITGCGNTVNSAPGGVPAQLMLQMLEQNLGLIKLDGTRFDLFGAIDRDTAQQLVGISRARDAHVAGEPYAYPYDASFWTNYSRPVAGAGLWDHAFRTRAREMARFGAHHDEVIERIGGAGFDWFHSWRDRTAIVETHDGETVAAYHGGDLRRVALTSALQLSTQGHLLIGPGQPVAHWDSHLDNAPVELFKLTDAQTAFRDFFLNLLAVRKSLRGYFAFENAAALWQSARTLQAFDTFSGAPADRAFGLLVRSAAPGFENADSGEVLLLFNFSDRWIKVALPDSQATGWDTLVDSAELRATTEGSLYPPAKADQYEVSPFNIVWLRRSR